MSGPRRVCAQLKMALPTTFAHSLNSPVIKRAMGMLVAVVLVVTIDRIIYSRTSVTGRLYAESEVSTSFTKAANESVFDIKLAVSQSPHGQHPAVSNEDEYAFIVHTDCLIVLAKKQNDTRYAVFSANWDETYTYSFLLPLTTMAWRRIGYGSVVVIVGNLQKWRKTPVRNHVLESTLEQGAIVVFLQRVPAANSVMLSQISRLLAAALVPFNSKSNIVLVTSDADIWPGSDILYGLPPSRASIKVLNAFCCGKFKHKGKSYHMHPMTNIIANVTTWRTMIQRRIPTVSCATDIVTYAASEFGSIARKAVHKGGNDGWYMDQHMVSMWIADWNRRHDNGSVDFVRRHCRQDRIDRIRWAPDTLKNIVDVHMVLHAYNRLPWERTRPLLNLLYGNTSPEYKWCEQYREQFVKLMPQVSKPSKKTPRH